MDETTLVDVLVRLLPQANVKAGDLASETFNPVAVRVGQWQQQLGQLDGRHTVRADPLRGAACPSRGSVPSRGSILASSVNGQDHRSHLGSAISTLSIPVGCTSVSNCVFRSVPEEQFVSSTVGV